MLLKECSRCKKLMPYGRPYCDECAPIVEAEREARKEKSRRESDRRYNRKRDPKYGSFYNSKDWRVLARVALQRDGYRCVKCQAIASEVDHIIPIQTGEGWEKRLDLDNLQSLCVRCHNEKHRRFQKSK